MKQKKIIIFMPSIEGGGVEKNFFIITNYLSSKLNNISVISLSKRYKKYINKKIKFVSLNSYFWESISRRKKFLVSLFLLIKLLISNKNVTVLSFQGHAYCILISKMFNAKIIVRSNSSPSGWSQNFLKNFFYKKIYSFADKIIVNSFQFKKEMKKRFNLNSICIYNPLNLKEIIFLAKKKINFSFFNKSNFNLINVARLNEQKDQIFLLNAINKIKNTIPLRLLIIGSGSEKNKLSKFIKKNNLERIVKILPFTKNPFPYILKSDLFVLTSKYEGLPNVLLETMSLKKIILSSNCPTGPKEILSNGKGGFLYKKKNINDFIKKLFLIYENKTKYKKKTNYGYNKLNRFDYNQNLKKYFNLLLNS